MEKLVLQKNEWLRSTLDRGKEADRKLQTYYSERISIRDKTITILKQGVDKKKE
jgi:hypothetical protein